MKKIDDVILKYLSGMLSKSELELFEAKLKSSDELAKQLYTAKEILSDYNKSDFSADERYFTNLLPKTRKRIDAQKSFFQRKITYYLAPVLTVIVVTLLLLPRNNNSFESYYRELAEVVINNIDDDEVTNKYLNDFILDTGYTTLAKDTEFSLGLETAVNKIPDSYLNIVDYSNSESFQSLEKLPDEDLNNLYKELSELKFQ